MRQYCAIWSLPPLNVAVAADQKVTPPPPMVKRPNAAAEAYSVGADVYFGVVVANTLNFSLFIIV
jgi:hypothetical protein